MPLIKLIGELDYSLTRLDFKEGDIIEATKDSYSKVGAMNFTTHKWSMKFDCVVWPENYEFIQQSFSIKH